MLVGGLFASMGMVIASFCTSIVQIYLTAGVITGKQNTLVEWARPMSWL